MDFSSISTTFKNFYNKEALTEAGLQAVHNCFQDRCITQEDWRKLTRTIEMVNQPSLKRINSYRNLLQKPESPRKTYLQLLAYRYASPQVGRSLIELGIQKADTPKQKILFQSFLLELALSDLKSPSPSIRQEGLLLLETLANGEQHEDAVKAEACFQLGSLLYTQENTIYPTTKIDRGKALEYLKKASDKGHPRARHAFKSLSEQPESTQEAFSPTLQTPSKKTLKQLARHIAKGDFKTHVAASPLVLLKEKLQACENTLDIWKGLEDYAIKRLPQKQYPGAHFLLSLLHLYGSHNIAKNLIRTSIANSPRSLTGVKEAEDFEVALLWLEDTSIALRQEGFRILKRLAESENCCNPNIFFKMGELLNYGYLGATEVDKDQAKDYYKKANNFNSGSAALRLAEIALEEENLTEALSQYNLAAVRGCAQEVITKLLDLIQTIDIPNKEEGTVQIFTALYKIKDALKIEGKLPEVSKLFETIHIGLAQYAKKLCDKKAFMHASQIYKILLNEETNFSKIEPQLLEFGASLEEVQRYENARNVYLVALQKAQELKANCDKSCEAIKALLPHFEGNPEKEIKIHKALAHQRNFKIKAFIALTTMLEEATSSLLKHKICTGLATFLEETNLSLEKSPLIDLLKEEQREAIRSALNLPKKDKQLSLLRTRTLSFSKSSFPLDWESSPTITNHNKGTRNSFGNLSQPSTPRRELPALLSTPRSPSSVQAL